MVSIICNDEVIECIRRYSLEIMVTPECNWDSIEIARASYKSYIVFKAIDEICEHPLMLAKDILDEMFIKMDLFRRMANTRSQRFAFEVACDELDALQNYISKEQSNEI